MAVDDPLDRLFNNARTPEPTGDPLDSMWSKRAALNYVPPANPDAAGQANVISRDTGIDPDAIMRNLPSFQAQQQTAKNTTILGQNPKLAGWATDRWNAAVSGDDLRTLARVGDRVDSVSAPHNAPTLWNYLKGIGTSAKEGFAQIPSYLQSVVEDFAPGGNTGWSRDPSTGAFSLQPQKVPTRSQAATDLASSRARADNAAPEFKSWWANSIYGGVSSLAQNLPGMAASVATGTAAPALIAGAGLSAAQAYGDIKEGGGSGKQALLGSTAVGAIEAATEFLPVSQLSKGLSKLKAPKAIGHFLAKELFGEEVATVTQNAAQTAATPSETWGDYLAKLPADMRDTAIGVGIMGLAVGGAGRVAHRVAGNVNDSGAAVQAGNDATAIGAMMSEAEKSKTRERDPEAFRQFLAQHTEGTAAENMYVPAEKLRELMQSERFNPDEDDSHRFLSGFEDQINEAQALGGDVVIPMADAVTHLAGTDGWEAIRKDVRTSAGGWSENEAKTFEAERADTLAQQAQTLEEQDRQDQEARAPEQKVYDDVFSQLRKAGYTPDAANAYSSLWAARYATRAERLNSGDGTGARGVEHLPDNILGPISSVLIEAQENQETGDVRVPLSEEEIKALREHGVTVDDNGNFTYAEKERILDERGRRVRGGKAEIAPSKVDAWDAYQDANVSIQQDAPEVVASYRRSDQMDILINAMRGKERKTSNGPSLLEFISRNGGVEDKGGDIASMGGGDWHKGKFRRALIRAHNDGSQGSMMGAASTSTGFGLDDVARKAWDAGYFPNSAERPTTNDLLENIGAELRGSPIYSLGSTDQEREANESMAAAADSLRQFLDARGLDPDTATRAEIDKALKEEEASRSLGQDLDLSPGYKLIRLGDTQIEYAVQRGRTIVLTVKTDVGARGAGSARAAMNNFLASTDAAGLTTSLNVDAMDATTKDAKLKAFYKSLGYKPNKGRGADHAISEGWVREPQRSLNQSARGQIDFLADGRKVIRLFEGRDLSTLIHESGHLWLEELKADAANGSDQVKADWAAIQAWFKSNGHEVGDEIPTEAHELFARGFERYAMEGRSPSTGLRAVFDRFRSWLLRVYQVVQNLNAPITDEVRGVFDRMLATEDEIAIASEAQNLTTAFDRTQLGMTEAEYAAHQSLATEAKGAAYDALIYRTMEAIRRQRTKEWKDEERSVRDDVTGRINARPEFQALHLLRTGKWLGDAEREGVKVKLDRQWLVETYGTDALSLIPKGVPPIYGENGNSADDIADLVGFRSGDDLVKGLMGIEATQKQMRADDDKRSARARLIDEETAAEMASRHGDPLNDGSIEEEALAAVHNGRQGELIASEARALGRKSGNVPTPLRLAREWAKNKIAAGRVVDVASRSALNRYAKAAARAAKAAETAILSGNVDEAFRQKQIQMLNHALLSEAKVAADEVDAAVKRLSGLAKKRTIASVDQDYLDRAHAQLEKYEFKPRSQKFLDEVAGFANWANEQRANGIDVVDPPRLEQSGEHYSRISVDELRGLRDSVNQIIALGRLKQSLMDGQEARAHEEVVAEAEAAAGELKQRPPSDMTDPNMKDRLASGVAAVDASLLKMETIFDWLDGGKADGVFNRMVFKPISDAQDRENDMLSDYYTRVKNALAGIPKERLKRWQDHVTIPELVDRNTGQPVVMNRKKLVSMALNMGNAGNVQRLTDGYGWNEAAVRAVLNRELTAEEWKYAQNIWDIFDTLWPQISELERRVNGFPPEKVDSIPVETPHGTFPGGYFPAVYDPKQDTTAEAQAGKESDLFSSKYTRSTTRASSTKERAEKVKRPLLLDLGIINRHLGETIHDITHREAVINADKFLSDKRVMAAVDKTLGPQIRGQFRPWLKFVANRWAMERAGNEGAAALINKARSNATVVGMGFRASTIITQIAGYANSVEVVGGARMAESIAAFARSPVETSRFVMERSGEMRHRMDTLDRDIGDNLRKLTGRTDYISLGKKYAFHGIGYMDRVVSVPSWMAGYNRALAEGKTEEQAMYEGDKVVRQSQGAGSPKDLASIQRGTGKSGEMLKMLTMFYSYFSAFYQRQRTLGRDVGQATRERRISPRLAARAFWILVVPSILTELLAGRGPDDDEDWGSWAFQKMVVNSLGPIPIVKDLADPVISKVLGKHSFNPSITPLQRAYDTLYLTAGDVGNIVQGNDTKRATRDALDTAGYTTGLVPGQISTATQFLVDVGYGEQDPKTVSDWYRGLSKGKTE